MLLVQKTISGITIEKNALQIAKISTIKTMRQEHVILAIQIVRLAMVLQTINALPALD